MIEMSFLKAGRIAAIILCAGSATACQTNGGLDIQTGPIAGGNKATIITKTVCGGGTHVAVVTYNKANKIQKQTQSSGADACTTGANVIGNIAGAAIGAGIGAASGGGSSIGNVTAVANAVAVSRSVSR